MLIAYIPVTFNDLITISSSHDIRMGGALSDSTHKSTLVQGILFGSESVEGFLPTTNTGPGDYTHGLGTLYQTWNATGRSRYFTQYTITGEGSNTAEVSTSGSTTFQGKRPYCFVELNGPPETAMMFLPTTSSKTTTVKDTTTTTAPISYSYIDSSSVVSAYTTTKTAPPVPVVRTRRDSLSMISEYTTTVSTYTTTATTRKSLSTKSGFGTHEGFVSTTLGPEFRSWVISTSTLKTAYTNPFSFHTLCIADPTATKSISSFYSTTLTTRQPGPVTSYSKTSLSISSKTINGQSCLWADTRLLSDIISDTERDMIAGVEPGAFALVGSNTTTGHPKPFHTTFSTLRTHLGISTTTASLIDIAVDGYLRVGGGAFFPGPNGGGNATSNTEEITFHSYSEEVRSTTAIVSESTRDSSSTYVASYDSYTLSGTRLGRDTEYSITWHRIELMTKREFSVGFDNANITTTQHETDLYEQLDVSHAHWTTTLGQTRPEFPSQTATVYVTTNFPIVSFASRFLTTWTEFVSIGNISVSDDGLMKLTTAGYSTRSHTSRNTDHEIFYTANRASSNGDFLIIEGGVTRTFQAVTFKVPKGGGEYGDLQQSIISDSIFTGFNSPGLGSYNRISAGEYFVTPESQLKLQMFEPVHNGGWQEPASVGLNCPVFKTLIGLPVNETGSSIEYGRLDGVLVPWLPNNYSVSGNSYTHTFTKTRTTSRASIPSTTTSSSTNEIKGQELQTQRNIYVVPLADRAGLGNSMSVAGGWSPDLYENQNFGIQPAGVFVVASRGGTEGERGMVTTSIVKRSKAARMTVNTNSVFVMESILHTYTRTESTLLDWARNHPDLAATCFSNIDFTTATATDNPNYSEYPVFEADRFPELNSFMVTESPLWHRDTTSVFKDWDQGPRSPDPEVVIP